MTIFIGPTEKPITGQSKSFHLTYNLYDKKKSIYCYPPKSESLFLLKNIIFYLSYILTLPLHKGEKIVYLTSSRSLMGFFRDALVILYAKIFSFKIINHLHGADFLSFRENSKLKFLIDYVYKKINKSIVLFPKMREQYAMYPAMEVFAINNATDFQPLPRIVSTSRKGLTVGYLSNIMYSKGIFDLINAVNQLVDKGYNIKLIIAGEILGDSYLNLESTKNSFLEKIKKPFIKYHGSIDGKQKQLFLQETDLFCLPTFYPTEAQPISIIEAMLAGCTILTTKHNYLSEMIDERNGYLINKDDSQSLIDSIQKEYFSTDYHRISSYNMQQGISEYSFNTYAININKHLI
ncbi:glycosyltransferase family 4 protein [Providencia rettgeri]